MFGGTKPFPIGANHDGLFRLKVRSLKRAWRLHGPEAVAVVTIVGGLIGVETELHPFFIFPRAEMC